MIILNDIHVTFSPDTITEKKAGFKGISLTIQEGEFVTVIKVMVRKIYSFKFNLRRNFTDPRINLY